MKSNLLKLCGIGILIAAVLTFNSCSDSDEEPDPCQNGPQLSVDEVTISIEGQSNGEITVSATSGTAPYMYSINGSNFQSSGTFSNLAGGNYEITVKDANDCTDSETASVIEVPEVSYADDIRPIIDTNCQLSGCHGDNANIPTFATYDDVYAKADAIRDRTTAGTMPPGDAELADTDVQLISDWVTQGAPDN